MTKSEKAEEFYESCESCQEGKFSRAKPDKVALVQQLSLLSYLIRPRPPL